MTKVVPIPTFKNDVAQAMKSLNDSFENDDLAMLVAMGWPRNGESPVVWTVGSCPSDLNDLLQAIGFLRVETHRLEKLYQDLLVEAADDEHTHGNSG